ncbi:hypothetical protein JTB14_021108 [Gonioctena quinquepunctata]|nr:hypothetical protein JTB14_021108 [Gonioctena quinquepunctata]
MWNLRLFLFVVLELCITEANVPQLDGRIIGGTDVNITSFPYQVSVMKYSSHICGGSIFHSYHILTAAHCVINGLPKTFSVRVGSTYVNRGGSTAKVCAIHPHEKFDDSTMDYDIAILTLCTPLTFSASVLPIALPGSTETVVAGVRATVSGWGYTKEDANSVSASLKQVDVPVVDLKKCNASYKDEAITKNMICAGYVLKGGKDACQGDSGGPLMANGKLFGVVSWGYGCAQPRYPGVYTNVPVFRAWIKRITKY